jgi:hypothetical protein
MFTSKCDRIKQDKQNTPTSRFHFYSFSFFACLWGAKKLEQNRRRFVVEKLEPRQLSRVSSLLILIKRVIALSISAIKNKFKILFKDLFK